MRRGRAGLGHRAIGWHLASWWGTVWIVGSRVSLLCAVGSQCFVSLSQFPAGAPSPLFLSLLPDEFKCPVKEETALTSGEWEVLARHGSKVPESPCTLVHTCAQTRSGPSPNLLCVCLPCPTWSLLPPVLPPPQLQRAQSYRDCGFDQLETLLVQDTGSFLSTCCWVPVGGAWPILRATWSVLFPSFHSMKSLVPGRTVCGTLGVPTVGLFQPGSTPTPAPWEVQEQRMWPQGRPEAFLPFPQMHHLKNMARLCLWLQHLHWGPGLQIPDFTKGPLNQTSWLPPSHQHKCLLDQRQTC